MSLVVPDVGEVDLLNQMINGVTRTLQLITDSNVPAETDTNLTHTKATFTGYADASLAGASWGAASTVGGVTSKSYAAQTFAITSGTQTITGYQVLNGTTLDWVEAFATPRALSGPSDTLQLTPKIQLD